MRHADRNAYSKSDGHPNTDGDADGHAHTDTDADLYPRCGDPPRFNHLN